MLTHRAWDKLRQTTNAICDGYIAEAGEWKDNCVQKHGVNSASISASIELRSILLSYGRQRGDISYVDSGEISGSGGHQRVWVRDKFIEDSSSGIHGFSAQHAQESGWVGQDCKISNVFIMIRP